MMNLRHLERALAFALFWCFIFGGSVLAQQAEWQTIDKGLDLGIFQAPQKSKHGDSKITVLRIDPAYFDLKLISAKELKTEIKTAKQWSKAYGLIAAVNTGMFQADYRTSVSLMKNYDHYNNKRVSKDNTIVAFNRKNDSVPPFQIIDRTCQDWPKLQEQYHTLIQGIRMLDCHQQNRWSQQPKEWSTVAIGADKQGRVLFLFTRSPYSVHDFNNILKKLPLDIYNAMYLEGGPEASFYVDHNQTELELYGSFETGFNESDGNDHAWPIPNVIGVVPKKQP